MSLVIEYSPEKICRVCTNFTTDCVSLFESKLSPPDCSIAEFLQKITNLQIVDTDGLPIVLCAECLGKISTCSELIQMSLNSDAVLREIVKNLENESLTNREYAEDHSQDDKMKIKRFPYRYKCETCEQNFSNKRKFNKHKSTHRKNSFKCEECPETFSCKSNLTVHLRSHVSRDKLICTTCGEQLLNEYLLKQHEFKHSEVKPFPCDLCERGFTTAQNLDRHKTTHTGYNTFKRHVCSFCSKVFVRAYSLADHVKIHTGEKPFLCSVCGKTFRISAKLKMHQRQHTGIKPYKCKICNRNFTFGNSLKAHMRTHTNERPYQCNRCDRAFKQSNDLKAHLRAHSGEKPILCLVCGKRLCSVGQLTVHMRSHTGEKPFQCLTCHKAFTTKPILSKHERIHTGEKPYICNVCGRTFNQSNILKAHTKTHNIEMEEYIKNTSNAEDVEKIESEDYSLIETEIVTEQLIHNNYYDDFEEAVDTTGPIY